MLTSFALTFLLADFTGKATAYVAQVNVGAHGPYPFLVDTGAEVTLVDTALAETLQWKPQFRTELVNVNGSRLVPGLRANGLRVDGHAVDSLEILIDDPVAARRRAPAIRGVLGANALRRFDFLLSTAESSLAVGTGQRPAGEAIPFAEVDGRIMLRTRMGQEPLRLVLDSGANHIVLFKTPAAMAGVRPVASQVTTMDGARQAAATTWTAEIKFSDRLKLGTKPAAVIHRQRDGVDGLMPASLFRKVFVDRHRNEVVLVQ